MTCGTGGGPVHEPSVPPDPSPPPPRISGPRRLKRALRLRTRFLEWAARLKKTRFGLRLLHNLLVDLRYGGWCGGRTINPFSEVGAFPIQSMDYAALTAVHERNGIELRPDDVLVDVGCGRGRVLNWWLARGHANPIIGLELVADVAADTARRLRSHPNVTIRQGDAMALLPREGTFFFLYSPFDRAAMLRFRDALRARIRKLTELRILYFNCRFVDVFEEDPHWRVRYLTTGEPEPAALIQVARAG